MLASSMKALEITVSGEVQRVGYRRQVEKVARNAGITGYVKNQTDGTVKIVTEGDEKRLRRFVRAIAIREPPIDVRRLDKRERRPTGRYRYFMVRPGSLVEELQEGLGAYLEQLSLLRNEFLGLRRTVRML